MTWRLVVPPSWGTRGDPAWLPTNGQEAWQKVFLTEDMAGRFLRDHGGSLRWRTAAESCSLLASVLGPYRTQLRIAEEEAARCPRSSFHLAALAATSRGVEPPSRSHPAGPWRVSAWEGGEVAMVAHHASVDGAEGDAVARRTGDATVVCWAEPDIGPVPPPSAARGWQPRVDRDLRYVSFAAEDAVASLCAGAADCATGPDVLTVDLLCLLGQAAWRSILEYRTLLAAIWTDLESCPHAEDHEAGAAAAMRSYTDEEPHGPEGPWRHVLLHDRAHTLEPVEISVHQSRAGASASVAVERATDEVGIRWTEPVTVGPRRSLIEAVRSTVPGAGG